MRSYTWQDGSDISLPLGKVVCVGRNYLDHVNELHNEKPEQPVLFIKPETSLTSVTDPICLPEGQGPCHNEIEIAFLIGQTLHRRNNQNPLSAIAGLGLALDLTLRDVQTSLKDKGLPWERAKAFDGACPVSQFVSKEQLDVTQNIPFYLTVNGERRQTGNTQDMLFDIPSLLTSISQVFTLKPGDLVLTGTPAGVGPLHSADTLEMGLADVLQVNTHVQ